MHWQVCCVRLNGIVQSSAAVLAQNKGRIIWKGGEGGNVQTTSYAHVKYVLLFENLPSSTWSCLSDNVTWMLSSVLSLTSIHSPPPPPPSPLPVKITASSLRHLLSLCYRLCQRFLEQFGHLSGTGKRLQVVLSTLSGFLMRVFASWGLYQQIRDHGWVSGNVCMHITCFLSVCLSVCL